MKKTALIENKKIEELTPCQTDNDTPVETSEKEIQPAALTHVELEKIRENINKMIDAMNQKSSVLFHVATFWGWLPWWSKIIIGAVLTVPTLVLGILAQIVALLVISAVTLVCFVGFSLLMDDLDNDFNKPADGLKSGVNNLADMLGTVINALGNIREQLSREVSNFKLENEKLADNVESLHHEVQAVGRQGKRMEETAKRMESTAGTLDNMVQELQDSTMELLEKKKMELMKTSQDLSDKVIELNTVKSELGQQIVNLSNLNDVLSGTITMMSKIAQKSLANEEQQEIFQKKLDTFLNNKEESFTKIASEFSGIGRELFQTKEELNQTKNEFQKINENYKIQVQELKSLNQKYKSQLEIMESSSCKKQQTNVSALITHGFYGNQSDTSFSSQQNIFHETQGLVN